MTHFARGRPPAAWCCALIWLMLVCADQAPAGAIPASPRSGAAARRQKTSLTAALAARGLTWGAPVYIRIFKQERLLELWMRRGNAYRLFRRYTVCTLGGRGPGPKTTRGDGRAPEGFYYVPPGRMNPFSRYHLAFNVGYPNAFDRIHGRTGGSIMVHGNCASIGCFAMTDAAMEEIYALADAALRHGQSFFRVHIFPFVLSAKNLARHRTSPWFSFWSNLRQGYRWFATHGNLPPDVRVENGRYAFYPARWNQ